MDPWGVVWGCRTPYVPEVNMASSPMALGPLHRRDKELDLGCQVAPGSRH